MPESRKARGLGAIIERSLRQDGFDGLYNSDGECACKIGNLMPCEGDMGGPSSECRAGYKTPCPSTCKEHSFHIQERKEATDEETKQA